MDRVYDAFMVFSVPFEADNPVLVHVILLKTLARILFKKALGLSRMRTDILRTERF